MNLLKATGTIGGLTLISRVLGLARDTLFARYVGASFASDAFLVAFRLPNMFRALFAEGAFASAFVPMFNQKVADPEGKGLADGLVFAEAALAVLLPVLLAMTVLLEVFAWPVTFLLSGKFHGATEAEFAFAVACSRWTIPYLMLISLVSLFGGILNSLHKFWVNAAAPILLNVTQIAAILVFHNHDPMITARNQSIAVSVSGALQLAWLGWAATEQGATGGAEGTEQGRPGRGGTGGLEDTVGRGKEGEAGEGHTVAMVTRRGGRTTATEAEGVTMRREEVTGEES